jgi:hypothetical protein
VEGEGCRVLAVYGEGFGEGESAFCARYVMNMRGGEIC